MKKKEIQKKKTKKEVRRDCLKRRIRKKEEKDECGDTEIDNFWQVWSSYWKSVDINFYRVWIMIYFLYEPSEMLW